MQTSNNEHVMGITVKKSENFNEWYRQILIKGKLIEYYDVSGCYVLLPDSFEIWEKIQDFLNSEFKKRNVRNCAFPLFITEKNLSREKDHIDGFTPEVAWVTHSGNTQLEEKIAIRPTSECAMYNTFSNLIRSKNDLPLKLNQWANVVRWEFKDCTPFIRSREFFWSEGHTAYDNRDDALEEIDDILSLYQLTYSKLLAIPTIRGIKTKNEKFAGADITKTIECYIPISGKGVQAATAHCLGQNFSKMFNITYQDSDGENKYVWQNSWGITTRSIGIMLMTHGDDKGLIIPPMISSIQIVIIPIVTKQRHIDVINKSIELYNFLKDKFRTCIDITDHNPGWKFNYWETKGIPIRIEIGPKDIDNHRIVLCRRDTFEKIQCDNTQIIEGINNILSEIHNNLFIKATDSLINNIVVCQNRTEFESAIDQKKLCFIKWCETDLCEDDIKKSFHAKSLCIPMTEDIQNIPLPTGNKCHICNKDAITNVLFGKSY